MWFGGGLGVVGCVGMWGSCGCCFIYIVGWFYFGWVVWGFGWGWFDGVGNFVLFCNVVGFVWVIVVYWWVLGGKFVVYGVICGGGIGCV